MAKLDIQKLILTEIQEIKSDMKQVRQADIPTLHTIIATLQSELTFVKEKISIRTMLITGIGGAVAVSTSLLISYFR